MHLPTSSAGWYRLVLTVSERKSKNKGLNTRLPKAEAHKRHSGPLPSVDQASERQEQTQGARER